MNPVQRFEQRIRTHPGQVVGPVFDESTPYCHHCRGECVDSVPTGNPRQVIVLDDGPPTLGWLFLALAVALLVGSVLAWAVLP